MLALMGIGMLGKSLYNALKREGIKVDFLLDNHQNGNKLDGITILNPSSIETPIKEQTTVIISTFKQELSLHELDTIQESLLSQGFQEVLNIQQAINRYNLDFEYFYIGKFNPKQVGVTQVMNLLSDEMSKKVFQAHIDFRERGEIAGLHAWLSQSDQYVPDFFTKHLQSSNKPLSIIDCGACYGDLLDAALDKSLPIGRYIAFEPDAPNRKILAKKVYTMGIDAVIFPEGVGEKECDLRFSSGQGMASHVDENGSDQIKIVPLDATVFGDIHWIKMDVEGFEYSALKGALKMIERSHPALSISAYHRPDDIVTLPLYLKQHYSKFYMRQHGRYGFDLVLYCFN